MQPDTGTTEGAAAGFSAKLALALLTGAVFAAFGWLWYHFGMDVVLAYAAGIAMQCF
jgi:hypothetical protein